MPNINFYPHPLTREGHEVLKVTYGNTLEDALQLNPEQSAIAIVDGAVYDHSTWNKVILTKDMVIQVRATVQGEDSNPLAIILSLAVIIAAPYLAGAILPAALPGAVVAGFTAAVQVGGILGISYLFPPRLPGTSSRERERQYNLTGGANRARPHEPFLLLLGTHRVFPDLVAQPYTQFAIARSFTSGGVLLDPSSTETTAADNIDDLDDLDGEEIETTYYNRGTDTRMWNQQILYQLFDFGIGDLDISNHRIGETLLGDFSDVETATDDYMNLIAGNVDTIQGGELKPNEALVRSTAPKTIKLQWQIVSQRFRYNDQNIIIGEDNIFELAYKLKAGNVWTTFDEMVGTADGEDARLPSRRTFTRDVPEGQYDIRVILKTAINAADNKLHANSAVFAFNAHQEQTGNFSGRNPYGMKIRATGQLSGRIEIFSADCTQRIPVWNGNAWVIGPTSNPAWIMRKFWLGWRRPDDNKLMAGRGIPLAMIDGDNLKLWGAFCDAMGLTCNVVIDRLMSTDDIEALIGQCGWASVSQATGKRGMVWENDDEPITAIFNASNIVTDSVDSTYENEGLADEIVGTFIDVDSSYEENTIRRTVPGVGVPERPVNLKLEGITNGTQAAKELNRIAAGQFYHQRIITFEVSSDGHPQYISRGSVIGLAHDLVGGSVGGRLTSINAARAEVTSTVKIPGAGIIWIWDLNGQVHSTAYAAVDYQITLMDVLPDAPVGLIDDPLAYRFMAFDSATTDPLIVRIVGIEHVGGGNFRITARDEIEQYYNARVADLSYELLPNRNRYRPVITPLIPPVVIGSQQWHFGMGAPAGALGRDGDNYLDTQGFQIWRKIGGLWANIANLSGADNAFWIVGDGPPAANIGRNGDFYFNKLNATIWRKTNVWIQLLDIDGIEAGAVWLSGNGIPPNNIGSNGHYYFQTSNGYVWKKEAGAWEFLRDVTGAQGPFGAHGNTSLKIWGPDEELRRLFANVVVPGQDPEELEYNGLLGIMNEDDYMIRESTGTLYKRSGWPFLVVHQYILSTSNRAIPPNVLNAPDGTIGLEISSRTEYIRVGGQWIFVAQQTNVNELLYCGPSISSAPALLATDRATFFIDIGPKRGDYYIWRGAAWVLTNNLFHELSQLRVNWATEEAALAAHFDIVEANIYPIGTSNLFRVADYQASTGPIGLVGAGGDVAAASDGEYWIDRKDGAGSWARAGNLLSDERIIVDISGITNPTGTLVASHLEISANDVVTLFWSTQRAVSAAIDQGVGNLSPLANGQVEVMPAVTTTYTMRVLGAGGTVPFEVSVTITVSVPTGAPVITNFSTNRASINLGESARLSWASSGGVSAVLNPGNNSVQLSGNLNVSPSVNTTYILLVTNEHGTTEARIRIIVVSSGTPQPVINSLTVSPNSVEGSGSVTVSWTTTNATRIVLRQQRGPFFNTRVDSTTRLNDSETETVYGIDNNIFTLLAYNADGDTVRATVEVTWAPIPAPDAVIDSFSASPDSAAIGEDITITWSTTGAVRVGITYNDTDGSGTLVNSMTELDGSVTFTQRVATGVSFFMAAYNIDGAQVTADALYVGT